MPKLADHLHQRIEEALSQTFSVTDDYDSLTLKGKRHGDSGFTLYYNLLEDDELLEITKILNDVYSLISPNDFSIDLAKLFKKVELNKPNRLSSKFVRMVLQLDGSSAHKLFLLTSGASLLSPETSDLVFAMAECKEDHGCVVSSPDMQRQAFFVGLHRFYILPSISVHTFVSSTVPHYMNNDSRESVDQTARLLAFIANRTRDYTFKEYQKIELTKAFKTSGSIEFGILNAVQRILLSENYKALAESMNARELLALRLIIPSGSSYLRLPLGIIENRARNIAKTNTLFSNGNYSSVYQYLSADEKDAVSDLDLLTVIDNLLLDDLYSERPPIIYASIAEIIAVLGERKAVEIVNELTKVSFVRDTKPEFHEAIVALIAECLEPQNRDLPFGWMAQMSEHAWVLHASDDDLEALAK